MGSDDICHAPDGAGVSARERSLERFRRHVQWSLAGTFALFVALFVEDWITQPDLAAWGRVLAAAALLVLSVATDRLEQAGGTLSWRRDDEWFELTGSLSLPAEAGAR